MSNRGIHWLYILIGALWVVGIMLAMFVFVPHTGKPFVWKELGDIVNLVFTHVVRHYLIVLLILLSAYVVGGKSLSLLKTRFNGVLEEIIFSLVTGLALLAFVTMFLGFIHFIYRPVLWIITVVPILAWNKFTADGLKRMLDAWHGARFSSIELVLLAVLLICVLMVSLNPLYPPVSLDAVNAYLSMAKGYLNSHWFELDPYIKYSMTPNNHTLLFMLAMGLGDEVTAVLMHFAMWCILLAAIAAFGARYLSTSGGLCGALVYALIPVTTVTGTWGNAENFLALYAFMSFWSLWRFVEDRQTSDAIITGLLLGYALGSKIFMGIFYIALLVPAGIWLISKPAKFPLKKSLIIVGISIVLFLPWCVRNIVYFGNPVFPYMNGRFAEFDGVYRKYEADLQSDVDTGLQGFSVKANDVTLLNLPVEMTFWPSWGSRPGKPSQMRFAERKEHGIGPLFLALLPLLIFVRRKWDVLGGMLVVSFLCILIWFYGLQVVYIRYWSFFFPFLAAAAGFAFAEVFDLAYQSFRKPYGLLVTVLIGCLAITFFLNGVMPRPGAGHLPLKQQSRDSYLSQNIIGYQFIKQLNAMDPKPRVYFLYGATSRFYCNFFVIAGFTSPDNYDRLWEHASTGQELHDWLKEIGITHLLVNEKDLHAKGKRLPVDNSFQEEFKKLGGSGEATLYEVARG